MPAHKTRNDWGHGGSPTLHEGRVYLVDDNEEESFAAAYDAATGRELWRVKREPETNYTTPFVWTDAQPAQLIVPATKRTVAYDLAGKEVWSFTGGMSALTICTPLAAHGLLYVGSGYFQSPVRGLFAIKPAARGDITLRDGATSSDAIAWSNLKAASYNPSPLVCGDELYLLYDQGKLSCFDARTGQPRCEKQRLGSGGFTASPWAHDGKIFCLGERAETFVVKAGPTFELLGRNTLEPEPCLATPALVGDSVILRTASKLYRIRNEAGVTPAAKADAVAEFSDPFSAGALAAGWTWKNEVPGAWRLTDGALHLRTQPGNLWGASNNAKNLLLRPLPVARDGLSTEVTMRSAPRGGYEQAGLVWYWDDDHYVKIVREHFGDRDIINFVVETNGTPRIHRVPPGGKESIVMNLSSAAGQPALTRTDTKAPLELESITTDDLQLRLVQHSVEVRGEWRANNSDAWQTIGVCPLPKADSAQAGLLTLNGQATANRWVTFRDLRISIQAP